MGAAKSILKTTSQYQVERDTSDLFASIAKGKFGNELAKVIFNFLKIFKNFKIFEKLV